MYVLDVLGGLHIVSCYSISIPLLPSITVPSLPAVELLLFIQSAAAATASAANDDDDDDDDDDYYANAYDFTTIPNASVFVGFRNQFLPYQLVPQMYLILHS
mmetsp:Transcript_45921/g.51363  ORF Transcript_45921/g.51363 Transcript_45921/m.51363 type:complete len:102 (-) Transcript_45921:68-373(-)